MATILCIEDEASLLRDLSDELRDAGYRVIEARDGRAGLGAVLQHKPDLVLCDITMPGMSGYDVLEALRTQHAGEMADVPFIFLTALAERHNIIEGKSLGADDYLTKPIDYDVLLATVSARLAQIERMKLHHLREITLLQRHLAQGFQTSETEQVQNALRVFDHLQVGVLIVEADRTLLLGNEDGLRAVQSGRVSISTANVLVGPTPLRMAVEAAVARVPAQSAPGPVVLNLASASDGSPLVATIIALPNQASSRPAQDRVAILLVSPEDPPAVSNDMLKQVFGLTGAEVKVVAGLLNGKTVGELVASHGISEATIRTQLKAIFAKTNTHRQAELVAKLNRLLAVRP